VLLLLLLLAVLALDVWIGLGTKGQAAGES
jgi:hypothetical protein